MKIEHQKPLFDEVFGVGTFYREIGMKGASVQSFQVVGDGTAAATVTVQHTDFYQDPFTGAAIRSEAGGLPPRGSLTGVGAGDARLWQPDAAVGTLTIAASTTVTGGDRETFSNQPKAFSRAVIVVTVGGRLIGIGQGLEN